MAGPMLTLVRAALDATPKLWTGRPCPTEGWCEECREAGRHFVLVIRADDDPERGGAGKEKHRGWNAPEKQAELRRLRKADPEQLAPVILAEVERLPGQTMNALGVRLLDRTADSLFCEPFEEALWRLADRDLIGYTPDAPVRFYPVAPAAVKGGPVATTAPTTPDPEKKRRGRPPLGDRKRERLVVWPSAEVREWLEATKPEGVSLGQHAAAVLEKAAKRRQRPGNY